MPTPARKLLDMLETERSKVTHTFQTSFDGSGQARWIEEYVERCGAGVHLFPRSTQRHPGDSPGMSAGVDPLYGDIQDPEFNDGSKRFNIKALVEHSPSRQRLTTIGIREDRDVAFWYPFSILQKNGLVTPLRFRGIDIGDLMVWDGTWYISENVHREYYFGSTDTFFFTVAYCIRYQHGSIPVDERDVPSDEKFRIN
jgi:hypothetical protein